MPVGNGTVLIGMGERSSWQAITQVARSLFAQNAARRWWSRPWRRTGPPCISTRCLVSATSIS
ncbi:arginine deiminase [Cutibacterium acnes JCM 18918]|nr:arginine deiminase [Cutibacterium acnes JCM 18918]